MFEFYMLELILMGKSQRNKGYRGEYKLVKLLQKAGIPAKRVPLSGATEFAKGDIVIKDRYKAEVKLRKDGFKELYRWLDGNDFLFVKADRKPYLVIMTFDTFIEKWVGKDDKSL